MFFDNGYHIERRLLREDERKSLSNAVKILREKGLLRHNDGGVEKAFFAYGLPFTENALLGLLPTISELTSACLQPAYSYLRVYEHGAVLEKHVDRFACEISVSITVDTDRDWPLYLQDGSKTISAILNPGDGLIYRGIDIPHWRKAFEGEYHTQVFLHYVKTDGAYRHLKFDKRAGGILTPISSSE
jgi:hypothetical protein